MPYPSQITYEGIISKARELIEAEGVDHLSLNKLSAALNVKTPSLYRYVDNRNALLKIIIDETLRDLFSAITPALETGDSAFTRAVNVALAYRDFAHAHPMAYGLAYSNTVTDLHPDPDALVQAVLPFQALMAEFAGEAAALTALRGFLALMHGFIMLELAGQLRRGGDLSAAYEQSIRAYLQGWLSSD